MVSVPKYTQTKHGNYSPNTHIRFDDIYSKTTQKKDDPYEYCFHTNYCVLCNKDSVTVLNMFLYNGSLYIYTYRGTCIYMYI